LPAASHQDIAYDLALLREVGIQAGQIAHDFFGHAPKSWLKDGHSPVSEADLAVDLYLKERLLAARPHYGWISEETQDKRTPQNYQRSFVVDPIDGTRGFLQKSPDWCVCVAVIEAGRPLCAILQCPAKGEQFIAHAAEGAWLNGRMLDSAPNLNEKRLRLSCSSQTTQRLPPNLAKIATFVSYIPSLAYRLALLAAGQVDVVLVRPDCHDWDIAAADLILHKSGCCLTDDLGRQVIYGKSPFAHGFLIAARQEIHGQIAQFFC